MHTEEFVMTLLLGMVIGAVLLMLVQAYGRRKAKIAVRQMDAEAQRRLSVLTNESDRHVGQIDRLQERLAVVERLVTDPAERTSRAIESLR